MTKCCNQITFALVKDQKGGDETRLMKIRGTVRLKVDLKDLALLLYDVAGFSRNAFRSRIAALRLCEAQRYSAVCFSFQFVVCSVFSIYISCIGLSRMANLSSFKL